MKFPSWKIPILPSCWLATANITIPTITMKYSKDNRKRVRCQISDVGIRKAMLEAQLLWQLSQDWFGLRRLFYFFEKWCWECWCQEFAHLLQENVGILRCYDFCVLSEPVPTLELLLECLVRRDHSHNPFGSGKGWQCLRKISVFLSL